MGGRTGVPSLFKLSPGVSPSATRKKLFEIARTFSEKTKRRKSKRKVLLKHHSYPQEPAHLLCLCRSFVFLDQGGVQAGDGRVHGQPAGGGGGQRRR